MFYMEHKMINEKTYKFEINKQLKDYYKCIELNVMVKKKPGHEPKGICKNNDKGKINEANK